MIFFRDKAFKNAENLAMTNENKNLPLSFTKNDILARKMQTTDNTTRISGEYAGNITAVAILEHNLTSLATVTLKLYTDTSLEATITPTIIENEIIFSMFESVSFNNFELIITDTSLEKIEIGKIMLGEYLEPTINSLSDFSINISKNDIIQENETGQRYTIEGVELREFSYSFPKQTLTESQELRTFYRKVGKHEGFLFMNFNMDLGIDILKPCFVFFINNLENQFSKNTKIEYDIEMKEAK